MITSIIYFPIAFLTFVIALIINKKYKWITKQRPEGAFPLAIFCVIWPITVPVLILILIGAGIVKYFPHILPDK